MDRPAVRPDAPHARRQAFHRPGWIYEEKVDGWRILAYKDGARVRLLSRTGVDHARRFREIAAVVASLPVRTLVLDGEVAIFDEQLRSRFDLLQHSDPDVVATPPVFIAFDLLYRDGIDLSLRSLGWRRARLDEIVTVVSWCFRCAGWRPMDSKHGPRSSSAAMRAGLARMKRARIAAGSPDRGSRSRRRGRPIRRIVGGAYKLETP